MLISALVLITAIAQAAAPKPELPVINAKLGTCSADFTVTDADKKPIYAAMIHVRIRYGFLGVKRMDLEVGTNSDGNARVEGLPLSDRTLAYDITKGDKKANAAQTVNTNCRAEFTVALK
jgi:hypothetical protein